MIQADIEHFVYFAEKALIDVAIWVFLGESLYRCDDIVLVATVTSTCCRKVKRERLVGGFRECWVLSASSSCRQGVAWQQTAVKHIMAVRKWHVYQDESNVKSICVRHKRASIRRHDNVKI